MIGEQSDGPSVVKHHVRTQYVRELNRFAGLIQEIEHQVSPEIFNS